MKVIDFESGVGAVGHAHLLAHEAVGVAAAAAVGEFLAVAGGLVEGPPLEVAAAPAARGGQGARGRVHCNAEERKGLQPADIQGVPRLVCQL